MWAPGEDRTGLIHLYICKSYQRLVHTEILILNVYICVFFWYLSAKWPQEKYHLPLIISLFLSVKWFNNNLCVLTLCGCYGVQMRYISYRYRSYVDICPTDISLTDLFPDHCNKGNIRIKQVTQIFGFLVRIKFMFILYYSLLSIQWHYA